MKKTIMLVFVLMAFVLQGPAGAAESPSAQKVNLALGSVGSSSGVYAFAISLAAVVHKYDPNIMVTAVEGGGGYDHAKSMKKGILDWSMSGSPAVYATVRAGVANFQKEGPWEPIRLMFMRNLNVTRIYVRADVAAKEGIRTWKDLGEKNFCPGIPGTRDASRIMDANKQLGTGIKLIPSSLADATRGTREGKLVGMVKGSPHDSFDAAMMESHYSTPLTVIGFAKDEADKLQAEDPMNTFMETSAGAIRELPNLGSLWEMSSATMTISSSQMSQETGYRIVKAVYKGWDEIAAAFPPCKGIDPIADAFKHTPAGKEFFFHAGVIQYAKEKGIQVPDRFIPPEYKDVK